MPIFTLSTILLAATFVFLFRLSSPETPRLVLLYATCTLKKDYLSPYKSTIRYTPNLETFAKESIIFARHQAETPFSGGAYASLFSGAHTYRHGVYYHPAKLADGNYLVAEAFRDHGYDTFFWNGHTLASSQLNYSQGVRPENVVQFKPWIPGWLTANDKKFTSLLKRLKSQQDYKSFVEVNFSMTHAPYTDNSNVEKTESFCKKFPEECQDVTHDDFVTYTPIYAANHTGLQFNFDETIKRLKLSPQQVRKLANVLDATYKSSVYLFDKQFGNTMKEIRDAGLINNSLIVFTSDHGEVLYRTDAPVKWFHSYMEPEVMNVPLMIRLPGGNKSYVYSGVTRSIDVFPTLAGLCEIKIPSAAPVDGLDLSPKLLEVRPEPDLVAYSCGELPHPAVGDSDPRRINVEARMKDTLYELSSLPDGSSQMQTSAAEKDREIGKGLSGPDIYTSTQIEVQLRKYKDLLVLHFKRPEESKEDWNEVREKLRSLGYLN